MQSQSGSEENGSKQLEHKGDFLLKMQVEQ
jgi:hypothetical protein